jgi:hypothetical protein
VLLYLAAARTRLPALAAGMAVAAMTVVPFLLWNWRPTIEGMTTQMIAPYGPRLDSDSLVALMGAKTGIIVSRWVSVAVQLLVAAIAWARLRRHGLGGLLLASALALCATFLCGWQAFINYYYLVSAMLVAAALPLSSSCFTGLDSYQARRHPATGRGTPSVACGIAPGAGLSATSPPRPARAVP